MIAVSDGFLDKLYEILATMKYNSERREILEEVLKLFLIEKRPELDIKTKVREIYRSQKEYPEKQLKNIEDLKKKWFKQEFLLLSNIPNEYIPEYIIGKYSLFSEEFEKICGFEFNSLWIFAFKFLEYLEFKKRMINFKDVVYKFRSREEYADLGFISIPNKIYIKAWENVVTFSLDELKRIFSSILEKKEIEKIIEILSLDIKNIPQNKEEIKFYFTPFLKINKSEIILLTPWYLTRCLPIVYEMLLRKSYSYLNSKGKTFEKLAQETLKNLPFSLLAFNMFYGRKKEYEADAILKFKKSLWVVEITSHQPSLKSLRGDPRHIKNDLKKAIQKCISQGKRFLENLDYSPLANLVRNVEVKGILIIVDGVYPQLNSNQMFEFVSESIPIYIINWFDLRTLVDQPEINSFEEFLMWRIQKPMPILSFDEKDYWAYYFDLYKTDEDIRKAFKLLQEKHITVFYVSYRFNKKEYLYEIVKNEILRENQHDI